MGINIDPQTLRSLAEDIDLYNKCAAKDAEKARVDIESRIKDALNIASQRQLDIVSFGTINASDSYSPVSVTLPHSLGVSPSKTMLSLGAVENTARAYVSSVTSTSVTVTVPAGYVSYSVFVLLMR